MAGAHKARVACASSAVKPARAPGAATLQGSNTKTVGNWRQSNYRASFRPGYFQESYSYHAYGNNESRGGRLFFDPGQMQVAYSCAEGPGTNSAREKETRCGHARVDRCDAAVTNHDSDSRCIGSD